MFPTGCTKTEKIYIKENNKKKNGKIVRVMPSAFFLFVWNGNSKLKMYLIFIKIVYPSAWASYRFIGKLVVIKKSLKFIEPQLKRKI